MFYRGSVIKSTTLPITNCNCNVIVSVNFEWQITKLPISGRVGLLLKEEGYEAARGVVGVAEVGERAAEFAGWVGVFDLVGWVGFVELEPRVWALFCLRVVDAHLEVFEADACDGVGDQVGDPSSKQ